MATKEAVDDEGSGPDVDQELPTSKRPLTGYDILRFQGQFNMQRADVIYALAVTNPIMLTRAMSSRKALEFSVELLLRMYLKKPGPAPWRTFSPSEGLEMVYGDVLKLFAGTEHEAEAQKVCERRMVQCFGRHSTTAYRWFEMEGRSKQVVARVLAKLSEIGGSEDYAARRDMLEGIARQMYHVRGTKALDEPLPTLEHPPQPRRRGPVPGSRRKPREDGAAAATAAAKEEARKQNLMHDLAKLMKHHNVTPEDLRGLAGGHKAPAAAHAPAPAVRAARQPAAKAPARKASAAGKTVSRPGKPAAKGGRASAGRKPR
jgi:hypothetical protein